MKSKSFMLVSIVIIAGWLLASCQPTATPTETQVSACTGANCQWTKLTREAVAAAIDREAIVDRVFEGRNTPAYGMVPPDYPAGSEPFKDKYGTRNLDLAKQLLTSAGYTADKPLTVDLWYPPDHYGTTTVDVMQVVKEQLEETGLMKVNLKTQAWAQYIGESVPKGKLDFNILGWFPDFADPETWLTPFASCNQSPDQGVFYCNPDMDNLLAKARTESDQTKRIDLYKQIGTLYAEEVPTLPLFWEPEYITVRKGVEGVAIASTFEFNYNVVKFADSYQPASGNRDTLIIGTTDQIDSLDPADAYATADWELLKNTGVALMSYAPGKSDLIPGVAKDFPKVSADGKTYTFTLRDGVKYADGTLLKAADYVRAWDRLSTLKGQVASLFTNYIDSVEAPDDVTVIYHLKDAYGFFPALVATAPLVPGNPKLFPKDALVPFPTTFDSVGPYQMVSFKENEQIVLQANPNYFGADKPFIPNVIIKYYSKPEIMSQAVEKGEIDIAWRILGAVEATRLSKVDSVVVTKINAPTLRYLVFNCKWTIGQ